MKFLQKNWSSFFFFEKLCTYYFLHTKEKNKSK